MIELLDPRDTKITVLALDVIKSIIRLGGDGRKFLEIFESFGLATKLVPMQLTTNAEVYHRLKEILEKYVFAECDELMVVNTTGANEGDR